MGHQITALMIREPRNKEKEKNFDLNPILLPQNLVMYIIDHNYTAYWQHREGLSGYLDINGVDYILYPSEMVIDKIINEVSEVENPEYALIATDYFGGIGNQWANVYKNGQIVNPKIATINDALIHLGIKPQPNMDAFDTVELWKYRSFPDELDKYSDLVDELGI